MSTQNSPDGDASDAAQSDLDPDRSPPRFRRFDTTPLRVEITPTNAAPNVRLAPIHMAEYPNPAKQVF